MISSDLANKHPESSARFVECGLVALICLFSTNHIHAAAIYKTYDAQGNVVFTDQPADEASAELLETPDVNVADPLPVAPQTPSPMPASGSPVPTDATTAAPATPKALPSTVSPATDLTAAPLNAPVADTVQQTATAPPESAARATTAQPTSPAVPPATGVSTAETPGTNVDSVARTANTNELADPDSASERVAIPVLPEGARPPVIGAVTPSDETQVSISWPTPDEIVLSTQSPIWVELDTQPGSLKALGLQAEIWIDDKLAVSGERPLLPLVLPEIGMHKLQVRLVDSKGNSVTESDSQLMDVRLGASTNR